MSAEDLWTEVTSRYDAGYLRQLTGVNDTVLAIPDATKGKTAAQAVINLWGIHAQTPYDSTNAAHVEIGTRAVIAQLWKWGGTSSEEAKAEWEEIWGENGLVDRVRRTGPRAHAGPITNSGVQQSPEARHGRAVQGWADPGSLPHGLLPTRRLAD